MDKHSPGPWTCEARNVPLADTGDYEGAWFITDANDERVVEIWEGRRAIEIDDANARLIAAAPALLASLIECTMACDFAARGHAGIAARAEAAIKAAESLEDSP